MKFCEVCGNKLEDDTVFCPECGTNVNLSDDAENQPEKILEKKETPSNDSITVETGAYNAYQSNNVKTVVKDKRNKSFKALIILVVVMCTCVFTFVISSGDNAGISIFSNKLEGVYYNNERSYLIFLKDGTCGRGRTTLNRFDRIYNPDAIEIMERGTYELKGKTLIMHLYDGVNYYDITYTYIRSNDTITIGETTYERFSD